MKSIGKVIPFILLPFIIGLSIGYIGHAECNAKVKTNHPLTPDTTVTIKNGKIDTTYTYDTHQRR